MNTFISFDLHEQFYEVASSTQQMRVSSHAEVRNLLGNEKLTLEVASWSSARAPTGTWFFRRAHGEDMLP